MPFLVRLYVRTAFVHLLLALGLWAMRGNVLYLRPAALHLFFVGWLTFLIFGVAYWMFPRESRERPLGRSSWVAMAYGLLLIGLWFRVVSEPLTILGTAGPWPLLLVAGAWFQWLGGALFTAAIWRRIRALGKR
jgi:hypothetical protein